MPCPGIWRFARRSNVGTRLLRVPTVRPTRDSLARGSAAAVASWPHACRSSATGAGAPGSVAWWGAIRLVYVPGVVRECRALLGTASVATNIRIHNTARQNGPIEGEVLAVTSKPSSSRRQKVVRSGAVKVALSTWSSSGWAVSELPSSEDLDPYSCNVAPARAPLSIPTSLLSNVSHHNAITSQPHLRGRFIMVRSGDRCFCHLETVDDITEDAIS